MLSGNEERIKKGEVLGAGVGGIVRVHRLALFKKKKKEKLPSEVLS